MSDLPAPSGPSKEDYARARLYTMNLINEVEKALVGEIEKIEGKVPSKRQLARHGVQRIKPNGETDYLWKGILLVTVKPGQTDAEGRRGMMLEIHKIVGQEGE